MSLLTVSAEDIPAGHPVMVCALAVSPDSNWVASWSSDFTIILWDGDGRMVQQWAAKKTSLTRIPPLAFSSDSRYLLASGAHRKVVIWDLLQGIGEAITFEGPDSGISNCAWHPDGKMIASAGSRDGSVRLWDAHTFRHLRILGQHRKDVLHVAFCSKGRTFVSTTHTGEFLVWDVMSGTVRASILSGRGDIQETFKIPAFDPGSMRLAAQSTHASAAAEIWHAETGTTQLFLGHEDGMAYESGLFSPDGKLLATALTSGAVKIWDSRTGAHLHSLEGPSADAGEMCFSPCGKYFAHVSRSQQPALRLWRVSDWTMLSEDRRSVTHIAFSPDGKTLWSGAADGTVVFQRMQDILAPQKYL